VLAGSGDDGGPVEGTPRTQRLATLRQEPATGAVIHALERWLHAPGAGPESATAGQQLLELLERHLAASAPGPGGGATP
jgi:hypothetical protein